MTIQALEKRVEWLEMQMRLVHRTLDKIDRKTEPQPCDTCRYYNSDIPCGSTPSACKEADKFAEEFVDGLKKLKPTADRTQGKWIRDRYWSRGTGMGEEYGYFYKCSLCEYEVENGYTRCGFNFCPYCGADMREREVE